jgi:hypothetical protein
MLVYINYESWYFLLVEEYLLRCFGKKEQKTIFGTKRKRRRRRRKQESN